MPVSPKLALRLALELRGLYEAATNDLIRAIAVQVGRGAQDATWQDRKLEALTLLMHDVDRTIDDLRREVPGAVERALGYAYRRGSAVASVEAEAAGITGSFGFMPDEEALTRLLSEAMRPHEQVILGIRRSVQDAYDQALVKAAATVLTGTGTRVDAARTALSFLADQGITGFTDRSGRKWDMASYAEMATRTSSGHAAIEGHMDRLTGLGVDTVYVSDSPEECDICRPFEGEVLSISGNTTGTLSDGTEVLCSVREARQRGLWHPNCSHSSSLFLPGFTKPPTGTDDADDYDLRQRQRAYERRIRKWKRRVEIEEAVTGKNDPHAKQARKKLRDVQAEFKTWRTQNDRRAVTQRTNLHIR